jgi:hypothetical protein
MHVTMMDLHYSLISENINNVPKIAFLIFYVEKIWELCQFGSRILSSDRGWHPPWKYMHATVMNLHYSLMSENINNVPKIAILILYVGDEWCSH